MTEYELHTQGAGHDLTPPYDGRDPMRNRPYEHCAQIAEQYPFSPVVGQAIAAKIRTAAPKAIATSPANPTVKESLTTAESVSGNPGLFDCKVAARPLAYALSDYHKAISEGPLNFTWKDKPHRIVYDLIAAVKYYAQPAESPLTEWEQRSDIEAESARSGMLDTATTPPADGQAQEDADNVDAQPAAGAGPVSRWIRVRGDCVIVSRCDWIYPDASDDEAGSLDERRYAAIGRRDGDIVLHLNGAWRDGDDLVTMLAWPIQPIAVQPDPAMAGDAALLDMMETLCIGLEWNIENHPEVMNESDAEALSQARALLKRVQPASGEDA